MKTGQRFTHDYGWEDARSELETGIHPEVVAARLGEPIDYLLEVADQQGWQVTYQGAKGAQGAWLQ